MNRRRFLFGLAALVPGSLLCCSSLRLLQKTPAPTGTAIFPLKYHAGLRTVYVNPEWRDAPYELQFYHGGAVKLPEPFPLRFRTKEDADLFLKRWNKGLTNV